MRYFLQTFGKHMPAPQEQESFFIKLIPAKNWEGLKKKKSKEWGEEIQTTENIECS